MFKCIDKKHNLLAAIGGAAIFVLTVLSVVISVLCNEVLKTDFAIEALESIAFFFNVLIPILLVGVLVLLLTNGGERKFESKWWIVPAVVLFTAGVTEFASVFRDILNIIYENARYVVDLIWSIVNLVGYTFVVMGLLEKKLWKLSPIGFGAFILSYIISIIEGMMSAAGMFAILAVIFLFVLSLGKENRILRGLAVISAVLSLVTAPFFALVTVLFDISLIILAFLIVPSGKVNFSPYLVLGAVFFAWAVVELSKLGYAENIFEVLVYLVFFAAPILLALSFLIGKCKCLAPIGYVLLFVGLIIDAFYDSGIWAFNYLEYVLTPIIIIKAISLLFFGSILLNNENPKNKAYKIVLIVLSIALILVSPAAIGESYTDYGTQISLNTLFAITMFISALVLVPFRYTKYQNIAKHIFLSIFTLGIWHFIWVYNVTKNLEIVDRDVKAKYTKELLLYMFVPFYCVYWNFKAAYATDKYAEASGVESKQATMTFLLSLFSVLVSSILIQNKINQVELKK